MKKSAIQFEKMQEADLGKITAAEFIEGLAAGNRLDALVNVPEKKKLELEVEPGVLGGFNAGRFIELLDRFRNEKKKTELELPPEFAKFDPLGPVVSREIVTRLDGINSRLADLERRVGG